MNSFFTFASTIIPATKGAKKPIADERVLEIPNANPEASGAISEMID